MISKEIQEMKSIQSMVLSLTKDGVSVGVYPKNLNDEFEIPYSYEGCPLRSDEYYAYWIQSIGLEEFGKRFDFIAFEPDAPITFKEAQKVALGICTSSNTCNEEFMSAGWFNAITESILNKDEYKNGEPSGSYWFSLQPGPGQGNTCVDVKYVVDRGHFQPTDSVGVCNA